MSGLLYHLGWALLVTWLLVGPIVSATWGYNLGRKDAFREARRYRDA